MQGDFCPAFFNTNKGPNDHEQATHVHTAYNACESLHTSHMDSDSDRDTTEPADSDTSDSQAIKSMDILQCERQRLNTTHMATTTAILLKTQYFQ